MSSVISANRLCDGRMSESEDVYNVWVCVRGFEVGLEGLTSDRTADGDIGLSILKSLNLTDLGVRAVALDIKSTMSGRTCFPSDCV